MPNPAKDNCLAIIGARGGSSRLPGKNRALLSGRPLFEHTLGAALDSGVFRRVIFSTDDRQILSALSVWPRVLPLARPAELADGRATMFQVARQVIESQPELFRQAGSLALLNPCNPFRNAGHLQEAFRLFVNSPADSLVSLTPFPFPPELRFGLANGLVTRQWSGPARKAEHPPAWYPNGAIALAEIGPFLERGEIIGPATLGFEMPWPQSLDIDYPQDLELARRLAGLYL